MSEKTELHDKLKQYLNERDIKYIHKNDARNHARGSDSGYPDFIIFLNNGIVVCIEFKTPEKIKTKNNGLNDKQIEWKLYLLKNKFNYYLLDNIKDAIDIINIF